jgi:hypothetical protein
MIKSRILFACICILLICAGSSNNFLNAKRRNQKKSCVVKKTKKRRFKRRAVSNGVNVNFSHNFEKFFEDGFFERGNNWYKNVCSWSANSTEPFSELILSWNAFRPKNKGKFVFFVSVKHDHWSGWYKLAEWSANTQKTFNSEKNLYVKCKHVRVELKKRKATAFKIKVRAEKGAELKGLKALFVCLTDLNKFCINKPNKTLPSTFIKGVPIQSQMSLDHPRRKDLCSPTSLSMLVKYFLQPGYEKFEKNLKDYVPGFAKKVHDDSGLDIYGNWILNVAQAYDSTKGNAFFKAQRLNGFNELYELIAKKIPVAVSVRGHLLGAASPYSRGHFMVVAGWDQKRQALLCIDPAFSSNKKTMRAYKIDSFLQAWSRSVNLSYIAKPKNGFLQNLILN